VFFCIFQTLEFVICPNYCSLLISGAGRRRQLLSNEPISNLETPSSPLTGHAPLALRRHLLLLDDDRPISMAPYIANLLDDAGIQVLVYNGDRDMSTCVQGSEVFLNEMEWSG
jgi:hypothetical protein